MALGEVDLSQDMEAAVQTSQALWPRRPGGDARLGTLLRCYLEAADASLGVLAAADGANDIRLLEVVERGGGVGGGNGGKRASSDGERSSLVALPGSLILAAITSGGPLFEPLLSVESPISGTDHGNGSRLQARGVAAPVRSNRGVVGAIYVGFPTAQSVDPERLSWLAESYARLAALSLDSVDGGLGELLDSARVDGLTGCLNFSSLLTALDAEIERSRRKSHPLSLLFIDIDDFKEVNDTLGHMEGNRVLAEAGRTLRENARAYDHVGRFGGDEFVVVLPETGEEMGQASADRLLEKVRAGIAHISGMPLTVSVGLATLDGHLSAEELLASASHTLTVAKHHGGAAPMLGGVPKARDGGKFSQQPPKTRRIRGPGPNPEGWGP
jgi:diguanylate cyclase (GGDEF)-like protein